MGVFASVIAIQILGIRDRSHANQYCKMAANSSPQSGRKFLEQM